MEYNYGLGDTILNYKDYPDPPYKLITIDFSYAMDHFTVYYPLGQRYKEDTLLERFEEIYQCHKCHDYYGRISDWEYIKDPVERKKQSERCKKRPKDYGYRFIVCDCEGHFCSNCNYQLSYRRFHGNKLILTPKDKDGDFYISFTSGMSMGYASQAWEKHFYSCHRKQSKQLNAIEWRKKFQKEVSKSLMRKWFWNIRSTHLTNIIKSEEKKYQK